MSISMRTRTSWKFHKAANAIKKSGSKNTAIDNNKCFRAKYPTQRYLKREDGQGGRDP